jgi:cysteinyl-tRNA synthetase
LCPTRLILWLQAKDKLPRLAAFCGLLHSTLGLLGVSTDACQECIQGMRELALKRAGVSEADIAEAIEARAQARKDRDYDRSDRIRTDYAALGIAFQDGAAGTSWRPVPVDR